MKKVVNLACLAFLILSLALAVSIQVFAKESQSSQPNIIIILTDDMGYADLGIQGQMDDLKTPHLNNLAETGVRMTAGYVTAPQCIPSRAGLLSGKYQQRFGLDHNGTIPFPLDEKNDQHAHARGRLCYWYEWKMAFRAQS